MATQHHILVSVSDPVLAKKVRFLLAGDQCAVEALANPANLERRLVERTFSLLILSRTLDGDDALLVLSRLDRSRSMPPTIVLGGASVATPPFVTLIPDPIDTQAIYRIASEALASMHAGRVEAILGEESTHFEIDQPPKPAHLNPVNPNLKTMSSNAKTSEITVAPTHPYDEEEPEEEISFSEVTGLNEIAGRLARLERPDSMKDAFDVEDDNASRKSRRPARKIGPASVGHAAAMKPGDPATLGGLLEPARFAKALHQCWSGHATGALTVARESETLVIHFEGGSPVLVESNIPGDQLGRALIKRGRITEPQYSDGAKRAIERGLRLGQALIELAFFTGDELGRELGTTAREQIVGCFSAKNGAFEFDVKRRPPTSERPYPTVPMGHVLAEGIRRNADDAVLQEILGDINGRYFELRRSIDDLKETYPLEEKEVAFLAFTGRAYNVADAADVAGITLQSAHTLMALLTTCEEVDPFTPGVVEFEARIREERERTKPRFEFPQPLVRRLIPDRPPVTSVERAAVEHVAVERAAVERATVPESTKPPADPPPVPLHAPPLPSVPPPPSATQITSVQGMAQGVYGTAAAAGNGDDSVPPMPVPPHGEPGVLPRPLVYAKVLPRGADGSALDTSDRTLSREHFQRGVAMLGQGNFASAEEAFRDAIALCSEEHVYMIGLARAIYYNPGYRPDEKVPVLKSLVGRAEQLAPDDSRVATLSHWIHHAEQKLHA